ncbi:uncharacterized protein LOC130902427 isoform X1 [Diorhabda carinulata]|uniref:uncharacterized protein LOC130902427 isoform X1 n=1 Tax=Diorhabda carinulata TaxID=1163345 RepID=UPI0025A1ABC9|nr:uncharacterized protein LOC130902427 isoform X1 [Diorhabda carinulata]
MCNVPPKFYQLCRLCLSHDKDNALFIFDKAAMERNILKKIMTCLSILVYEKDELPHVICLSCTEQLECLYKFRQLAKKTEDILHQFLVYTKELKGSEKENKQQSEELLENLTASINTLPLDFKIEKPVIPLQKKVPNSPREPTEVVATKPVEIKKEPVYTDEEDVPHEPKEFESSSGNIVPKVEVSETLLPPQDVSMDLSKDNTEEHLREPLIKVKPPSALHYTPESSNVEISNIPRIISQDFSRFVDNDKSDNTSSIEPTDLSNKKTEKLTCVPEISYIKEEADAVSLSSNSSDPERLEVDMSQVTEEQSDSTNSATSPISESVLNQNEIDPSVWQTLSRNGYNPPLSGEASQLLRKLITCRKLGMTITPAQPHVLNYTLFDERQAQADSINQKNACRRKQSYPSKATVPPEGAPMEQDNEEYDYGPDNSLILCNMGKGKRMELKRMVAISCTNCGTQTTTIWRRNLRGEMVCNACGLYFKLHGIDRPVTMRRDTIHTRRRRPKAAESEKPPPKEYTEQNPFSNHPGQFRGKIDQFSPFSNPPVHTYKGKIVKGSSKEKSNTESSDTEDMLSALRRQLQPHLVMALQGHRNNFNSNSDSSPKIPSRAHIQFQGPPLPNFLPLEKSSGVSTREAVSDEDSIADLPLNLVSTHMTEGELI